MHSIEGLLQIYDRDELESVYKKTSKLLRQHGAVLSYQRMEAPKPLELPAAKPGSTRPITSFFTSKQSDRTNKLSAVAPIGIEVCTLDSGSDCEIVEVRTLDCGSDCEIVGDTTPSQTAVAQIGPSKPPGKKRDSKPKARVLSAGSMAASRKRAGEQDKLDFSRQDSARTRCVANGRERAVRSCREKQPKYERSVGVEVITGLA